MHILHAALHRLSFSYALCRTHHNQPATRRIPSQPSHRICRRIPAASGRRHVTALEHLPPKLLSLPLCPSRYRRTWRPTSSLLAHGQQSLHPSHASSHIWWQPTRYTALLVDYFWRRAAAERLAQVDFIPIRFSPQHPARNTARRPRAHPANSRSITCRASYSTELARRCRGATRFAYN